MGRFIKRATSSYGFLGAIELSKIKTKTQLTAPDSAQRAELFAAAYVGRDNPAKGSRIHFCCVDWS